MSRALHPADVAVALRLLALPAAPYKTLAQDLGLSTSTIHGAVQRLLGAGLVRQEADGSRPVNRSALLEFLEHGVKYAFPASLGATVRGIPTAHSGPPLRHEILADDAVVWPDNAGTAVGSGIAPLLPRASELPARAPDTYALLTAVDALRVGRVRERALAAEYLRREILPDTLGQRGS